MSFEQIVFYGFSFMLIFSALMVILVKNSVKAALFLVLCFFASSALWLLLEAEFLAITLMLVYVGAVMVLFLFVVMMLDINYSALRQGYTKVLPIALMVALGFLLLLQWLVGNEHFGLNIIAEPQKHPADYSNVRELGRVLYTDYFYPFELAAVILLVAIIAAISLTFRGKRGRKSQDIDKQIEANKQNRLKVVKVEPVVSPKISDGEKA